jgi:Bardet-Biedl syndrome 2 protein
VHENTDIFYTTVLEGISTLQVGRLPSFSTPVILVAGECTVQGYDQDGEEVFWTMSGDAVTSLLITDINKVKSGMPS